MELTRRQLLKLTGLGLGGVLYVSCTYDLREAKVESPNQIPEDMVTGLDTWYATLCRECEAAEGIIVRVMEGRAKKIEGSPLYPLNGGKHGARCEAGLQALYHPDRLAGPLRRVGERGEARFEPLTWTQALDQLATTLSQLQGNPRSVVLVTDPLRGHLAHLVGQFANSYGARHAVLEPVEQTVLYQAVKRLYGQERLPHFDIAGAGYVLSFGADFLSTWLNPVSYMRQYGHFRQGSGRRRGTLVQVEPRFSMTAASADEWVPVNPGWEGAVALSMAHVIVNEGLGDSAVRAAMRTAVQGYRPGDLAAATGVPAEKVERVAKEFARSRPGIALGGGSVAAHTNGLFNLTAIYSLNLLVGNTNKPGGVRSNPPAPVPELVARSKPTTLAQWQALVEEMKAGRVQALIVRGADPLYGLPKALDLAGALAQVPLVVSFSSFLDDTATYADLVLPEHTGLEDWGDDVPEPGPGFQTVGFQQPVVRGFLEESRQADAGSRGFADVLLALAEGLPPVQRALPWKSYREMLMDGARKLHGLNRGSVRAATFDKFWVDLLANGGWWDSEAKAAASTPPPPSPVQRQDPQFQGPALILPGKDEGADLEFHLVPFVSNALGDGRSAHLPWLQAAPDPVTSAVWQSWLEINSATAREMDIKEGEILRVESPVGTIEVPAYPHPAVPRGVVAVPIGQGHRNYGRYAHSRGANVFSILAPAIDQDTGAFAWAATKVRLSKTGRQIRLPKFEGPAGLPVQLEGDAIIQVTPP